VNEGSKDKKRNVLGGDRTRVLRVTLVYYGPM